jgi:hypothetical protein
MTVPRPALSSSDCLRATIRTEVDTLPVVQPTARVFRFQRLAREVVAMQACRGFVIVALAPEDHATGLARVLPCFVEPDDLEVGDRVFDISVQHETVLVLRASTFSSLT